MPENLLNTSEGIPKSLLDQITATENDVVSGKTFIGSDGTLKHGSVPDRGDSQWAGGFGGGTDSSTKKTYISLNRIPEGIYRKNGAEWAPEIRAYESDLLSHFGYKDSSNYTASYLTGKQLKGDNVKGSVTINTTVNGIYFISWAAHSSRMDGPTLPSGMSWLISRQYQGTREGNIQTGNIHCYAMFAGIAKASTSGNKTISFGTGYDYACSGLLVFKLN